MTKKHKASFLFELMLGISISSGLFFILFKVYNTILKGTRFVKNISDIEIQKEQLRFNIIQDGIALTLPSNILYMYEIANKINNIDNVDSEKTEKDKNENKNEKTENNNKPKVKISEKEKNKIKKEFEEYLKYLPKLYKTDDGFTVSWITTRDLITKEKRRIVEVTYKIEKIKTLTGEKNEPIYKLSRIEKFLFDDKKNQGKKYTMIKLLENPNLFFISPIFNKKLEKENENKNENKNEKTENKSFFKKWKNNLTYKTVHDQKILDTKSFLENPAIPFEIIFECNVLSNDREKKIPLIIRIPIAIAEYALELFLDFEQKNKEIKERLKNSILDKNNNNKMNNKEENIVENKNKNDIKDDDNKDNKDKENNKDGSS